MPTQPAVLGTARLNNFRLGYNPTALADVRATRVRIILAGVLANSRVRVGSLQIHDALNDAPNTCSLTVDTIAPTELQDLRVTVNSDAPVLLFNGTLQSVDLSYEGLPAQHVWHCRAIDDLGRLNRIRPFGTWTNVSATTVAQELLAAFAPGFTGSHIEAGLPTVSVTFDGSADFSACLGQIAKLIGGYFYVEDLDLHLFLTEATDTPDPIEAGYPFLNDPPITATRETSQLRTRVYGKGHGEAVTGDVNAGDTIVPLDDAVMFNPLGGQAIVGTTPDGAQWQVLDYTGIDLGGAGSLVGPGVTPAAAPTVAGAVGAGVESGVHAYAYTWVTAAGETLPSPLATVTLGALADPTAAPTGYTPSTLWFGSLTAGGSYRTKYAYATDMTFPSAAITLASAASAAILANANGSADAVTTVPYSSNPAVTRIHIYRTTNGGATYYLQTFVANSSLTGVVDVHLGGMSDATLLTQTTTPGANTTALNKVTIAAVAIGPTGTTSRKVYRTAAGLAQLKLQQTIANNTATTGVLDATADGSLGANAPTSDTSGLTTTAGQVNAGSTTLLTASAGPFDATGGWVVLSSGQVARYTGLSGNTLTGIPATGSGSIQTTVLYGSPILASPALTGVTGVGTAIMKGATAHIWVQRDDVAAQAILVALDLAQGRVSDGVVEHTLSDERRGEASLIALCDADLALFSRALVTVTYATRDTKTKSGKTIVVNLPSPAIGETLTIQDVNISEIDVAAGLAPRFSVTASNVRFSLEDLLRRMAGAVGA